MHEFRYIQQYFAPLAGPAGLNLQDDAALLSPPSGCDLVITQDAMTAGIHFFADDKPEDIARKLLRVNLSDLAAKGAKPLGYFLSLLLPKETDEAWVSAFASGLQHDQQCYHLQLMGGDTSAINGPLTFSLTAIGTVTQGKMWRRKGAQPGDILYLTGTVGDAALGLLARRGEIPSHPYLLERYLLPQPRFLPQHLPISAAMDVSDGLLQDAGHLAAASGVGLQLDASTLPLSDAATPYRQSHLSTIVSGGDDYEVLFTMPPGVMLPVTEFPITRIGHVIAGKDVTLHDETGKIIEIPQKGWQHF